MATNDKYTSNWRGARRYQFDEEARLKRAAIASGAQPAQVEVWPIDTNRDRGVIGLDMGGKIASGKTKDAGMLFLWAIPAALGAVLLAVVAITITGDLAQ
ncbi:hypothetical protein [Mesorhizobium sp. 8]|uniref:hypothetical protein n=1 Tax=Mesorhizobium sp. 8 TaxID=2584466 RepID=UPI0011205983|nr:hypothetical protein [Mesorhizobium sp. 8]QDC01723.1 hypothetical protein FGU64_15540 [Mesorhizobium sp. 8]